jgi:hypothetical protein
VKSGSSTKPLFTEWFPPEHATTPVVAITSAITNATRPRHLGTPAIGGDRRWRLAAASNAPDRAAPPSPNFCVMQAGTPHAAHWTCSWDAPHPHVHPLSTPENRVVSVDGPADHVWHHGLWSTIKFVNGMNFWEEYGEYGTLHTADVEKIEGGVRAEIEWRRPDDVIAVREVRTIIERAVDDPDDAAYALDWEFAVTPMTDTEFDRTPNTPWGGGYSGLTLRGSPELVDSRLMLPDGEGRERVLGDTASWCALDGYVDDAPAGFVIADHPDNVRAPTPWYASTRAPIYGDGWGNFVNAAFLWNEPISVAAGDTLRRRHLVLVHDGHWDVDRVAHEYDAWLGS